VADDRTPWQIDRDYAEKAGKWPEGWGPFHRHFANDAIHRDGGPECDQPGTPRRVYVFDPDSLTAHEEAVTRWVQAQMAGIWIVLVEDRHGDVEALPFSSEDQAVAKARASVPESAEEGQLTTAARADGRVLLLTYGTEGDCVRVVKRTLDLRRQP